MTDDIMNTRIGPKCPKCGNPVNNYGDRCAQHRLIGNQIVEEFTEIFDGEKIRERESMTNDYTEEQAHEAIRLFRESIPLMQNAVTYGRHNGDDRYDDWLVRVEKLAAAAKPEAPGPWPLDIGHRDGDRVNIAILLSKRGGDLTLAASNELLSLLGRSGHFVFGPKGATELRDALCADLGLPTHDTADGGQTAYVYARVADEQGNPIEGASVTLHGYGLDEPGLTDKERAARIVADLEHFGVDVERINKAQ